MVFNGDLFVHFIFTDIYYFQIFGNSNSMGKKASGILAFRTTDLY